MKSLLNPRLIIAVVLGVGILAIASTLFPQDDLEEDDSEGDHTYGEPDGNMTSGDVASLVD